MFLHKVEFGKIWRNVGKFELEPVLAFFCFFFQFKALIVAIAIIHDEFYKMSLRILDPWQIL
jgi:hypothetical protein